MRAVVVGGGIAGLTAALALSREGLRVTVVEQAAVLQEVGAGIQLSSNGVRVLRELGIDRELDAVSIRPEKFEFLGLESGALLFETPLGDTIEEQYGSRFYQVHRADLLGVLLRALPPDALRLGARCEDVHQTATGVVAELADGRSVEGDLLVAADGIHSRVRERLFGEEQAQFGGMLMWRALVPAERLDGQDLRYRGYVWVGPGRSAVAYWVRRGRLFNFVGTVPAAEVHRESWSASGDVEDLRHSFAGCEPRLERIVAAIDQAFLTGLYFRDPLPRWTWGRTALLGDAAHAMMPFLAQGACQGIEDAWVLARCVRRCGRAGIPDALEEYERRRKPRTTKVQAAAQAMSQQMHAEQPRDIAARDGRWRGIAQIDPRSESVFAWLYGYDAVSAAKAPIDHVLGLSPAFEGKRMRRPEAQRAFDLLKGVFTARDVGRGVPGLREAYERFLVGTFPVSDHVDVEPVDCGGIPALWVDTRPPAAGDVLLHFHGGGYVLGSARASVELTSRLARATETRGLTVDYRLAPENPFPAAVDDAVGAYRWLLQQGVAPTSILLSGESSGGGLALATLIALKRLGDPLPAGLIALSPFTDLTVSGSTIHEFAGQDPVADWDLLVYFAGSYFQTHDPRDPLVSPLFGDFTGCPPMLLVAATCEVLLRDTTRLATAVREQGVEVTTHLYEDTVHVFPMFDFLPETSDLMTAIRAFGERCGRGVHAI